MSKFQSTVSTVAALCSIFGVAAAGWKVAESKHTYDSQQETIRELQSKLEEKSESDKSPESVIAPTLPPPLVQIQAPPVPQLPEPPPVQESEAPSPPPPTTF